MAPGSTPRCTQEGLPGGHQEEASRRRIQNMNGQCLPLCITKGPKRHRSENVCETDVRNAHFVTPDCSQDHAGTGRPGTRRGHLGALDGMSRPSRPPAPRSQHIGTERPATKRQRPTAKTRGALSMRVIPLAGAWPTRPDNMTKLPRGSSVGHRDGQAGSAH